MTVHLDPVLARRTLGASLRRLRTAAGLSAEDAAHEIDCSVSKISRIEKGLGVVRTLEVKVLLALYGVESDVERKHLLELVGDGRGEAWYDEYLDLLGPGSVLHRYIGLESAATEMLAFTHGLIPGLLQTDEYAHALYRELQPDRPDEEIAKLVQLRLDRRRAFLRDPVPLRLSVVLDESALLRPVGGPEVMRHQLEAVRSDVAAGRDDIRVLPLSVGFHRVHQGQFTVLTYASGDNPDFVFVEGVDGASFQDKPDAVRDYTALFRTVAAMSLRDGDLEERLDRAISEMRSSHELTVALSAPS